MHWQVDSTAQAKASPCSLHGGTIQAEGLKCINEGGAALKKKQNLIELFLTRFLKTHC